VVNVALGSASVVFTGRAEGDLGHGGEYVQSVRADVEARRRAVLDRPWSWLRQVHGDTVVTVMGPGDGAGAVADAAVTAHRDAAVCVLTADCAPIALACTDSATVAVVHAGWRGLVAGVIPKAVAALGVKRGITAAMGPCIHAECYEFGAADLDAVASVVGDVARGRTPDGAPALDLPAAVRAVLGDAGVEVVYDADTCTACAADDYFSFRSRGEMARQAVVAWLP
jgi:YfiH family protein